ncbi:MAG: hypothetical protein ACOWYE_12035, partial [Desulfatiglandales bacterium]
MSQSNLKKAIKIIRMSFCSLVILAGFVPLAKAAEISLNPSIGILGEYNDNIDFSRIYEEDDLLTRIRPALDVDYRTDLLSLQGRGAITVLRYLEETRRNTEYYDLGFNGAYKVTERVTANARFSYTKDETLESELEETGIVNFPADRTRFGSGGGVVYGITERDDIGLSYDYTRTNYDSDAYVDYDNSGLFLTYNRLLANMKDVFTVKAGYSDYDSDASKVENYSLYLGWAHPFTETLQLTCFLGGRYTSTDYSFVKRGIVFDATLLPDNPFRTVFERVELSESGWGGLADVSLRMSGETCSTTIGYNHDLTYSSEGDPISRDRLYFDGRKNLTTRLSLGLTASTYLSKSEGELSQEDSRHLELGSSLHYRLTENYSLSAGYNYSYHKDKTLSEDQGYDRN